MRKFRIVGYEVWRKGAKNPPEIDTYMPIGKIESKELTEDQLRQMRDDWERHKKLDKKKKRKKLLRRVAART